ncbi:alkali metal cation/H+ antiporter Nha1 C terminus-domain-containing protein [Hypoxylon sp. FL1284]|nr:alkali metal cation/H+ antiporter Nha1 C terminus-domain-containing protein [Hypoxylon sp. FL1284]
MAWDHLSITKPHLVYIILGGFTSLFMLCSSVIKERMYIGEATVATLCGVIFGPHAANLIDPNSWGSVDEVTLEFSRIVLVVQCFAVGVELPKYYMERHWKSVVFLLLPVMTFGWLITSLVVWWMFPSLSWLESLVVAACVTATDPVLASSVVGKGKFAKRVPKHLRDLLSAESGCNDGMAFPFIYLSLYLLQDHLRAGDTTFHFLVYTVLYECIFGAVYGFVIGYIARHGIKFAEKHDLIDRESFLVFYFTLALFCAGSGSILGVDDLLVGFACGVGFSNDGWFSEKTEESHVSNVIDLLINLAYFVFLGTIIPWEQYNNADIGLSAWRLVVMAIFVILFRRIPVMMALKPLIPDVKTWREALFAGHFGPIGVGAIFVALLARGELEHEESIPESQLPSPGTNEYYNLIVLVWPIVTFMVISSILVHGSSVAVFTLGKRINTLSLTMSFTTAPEEGPAWMSRLPRISSQSRSQARTMSDTDYEELKLPEFPPGSLPPTGMPGQFLRRQREEENPSRAGSRASSATGRRRSRKKWDDGIGPGGPVTQSAIFPQRRSTSEPMSPSDSAPPMSPRQESSGSQSEELHEKEMEHAIQVAKEHEAEEEQREDPTSTGERHDQLEVYDEGDHIVVEDQDDRVLAVEKTEHHEPTDVHKVKEKAKAETQKPGWTYDSLKKSIGKWRDDEVQKRKDKTKSHGKHEPARAYQFGNTIIVEDEDGEVVRKYDLPADRPEGKDYVATSLKYMGMGGLVKPSDKPSPQPIAESSGGETAEAGSSRPEPPTRVRTGGWPGFNRGAGDQRKKGPAAAAAAEKTAEDDRGIRFTIGGVGQRMTKEDFLKEVQKLDVRTRREVVEQSTATPAVKSIAKEEPRAAMAQPEAQARPQISITQASDSTRDTNKSPSRAEPTRGRSATTTSLEQTPASDTVETAAERRRRLAAFASVREDHETGETPAERRRREAALGVEGGASEDSDSDDDDTPRVPPARRGIRFADSPAPR